MKHNALFFQKIKIKIIYCHLLQFRLALSDLTGKCKTCDSRTGCFRVTLGVAATALTVSGLH